MGRILIGVVIGASVVLAARNTEALDELAIEVRAIAASRSAIAL